MIGDTNAIASSSQQTTVLDITVTGANNLISGGTVTVMMGDQLIAEDITDTMGKCTIQLGLTNGVMSVSYEKDGNRAKQTVNVAIGVTTQVFLTIITSFTFTMNYNASNFVSSPNNCLTYADGCAGFTPVSGPGSSGSTPAKCTNIGSWVMNADGTSSNKLLDKCFYATFTNAGVLHEKLNPQDLTKKIATWNNSTKEWVSATGSSSITSENTMFCIPTIYVSSTSTSISLSTKVGNGNPFAHTIDNHVYQYMAIGVYQANWSSIGLKSISGATSAVELSQPDLVTGCRANTVQNGKAILCNWFQWQLYRLLVLFSIRHFNSQEKIGQGGQKYGEKTTGLMDAMGPFAGSSSTSASDTQGVKAYIENPWGHNWEYLGDFGYVSNGVYAFQTSTQNPTSTTGGIRVNASPYSLTTTNLASGSISTEPETWGWGTGKGGSATTGGCDYQYLPNSGYSDCVVGGPSEYASNGKAGVSYLDDDSGYAVHHYSGRLVFVFDLDGGGRGTSEPI